VGYPGAAPGAAPPGYPPPPYGYGPAPTFDPHATWGAPGQPTYSPPIGGTSFDNPYFLVNPVPRENYNTKMMIGGIFSTFGGVAMILVGSIVLASSRDRIDVYCDGPRLCGHLDDLPMKNVGLGMMITGVIAGGAGVPLWIIGSKKVVAQRKDNPAAPPPRASLAPELRITGTGAALRVAF
jgi:hypothetical protein